MQKVAFVTGSGSGLGRHLALYLARAGYDVAVHYSGSEDRAMETVRQIEAMGRKARAYHADLMRHDQLEAMFDRFEQDFDRLDVYVNNAGITLAAPFLDTDEALFDQVCGVNMKGAYFAVQRAARFMARLGIRGAIVIITSNNYFAQFGGCSVYGSLKAALVKLARHAAIELARHGIRVNALAPGWINTGEARMGPMERTFSSIPLKRWVEPDEIGDVIALLAGPAGQSITGACLMMDGGATLLSSDPASYGL